jgi:enoyl-CoA hydratase/carnithine racemase
VVFNRPDSLNAMSIAMEYELSRAWQDLDRDPEVRVIVISGSGRAFQVGVDLKEVAANGGMAGHQVAKAKVFGERPRSGVGPRANRVAKPIISAVNGVCAGLGFHFVMDSDIVICSSNATFTDPHISMGQVSALEPIGLLPMMPFGAVMRMVLVGAHERIDAQRAYELGLVTEVVDPPDRLAEAAQELAEKIAKNSPSAAILSKRAIWNALECGRDHALADGHQFLRQLWGHPDNLEGAQAFAQKRSPEWAKVEPDWMEAVVAGTPRGGP